MAHAVGIDLGTTNSVISLCRGRIPGTISIDGRNTMPSVVSFRDDGTVIVGLGAKARMLVDPEHTVASAKRFMGERRKEYHVAARTLTPVDVSALILERLIEGARDATGEDIRDAVITVPAYFDEAQREDTKRAGEQAGLNVLRLAPEPTAAAIAYGLDKGKDQTVMVYDLGGGTFDVSILLVKGNTFSVKAVGGDTHLGGDDFDAAIMGWASSQFQSRTGIDLLRDTSQEGRMARQRLKEASEAAKIELSEAESASIIVPDCMGHPLELELSLAKYNELIAPLLKRTVDCLRSVLRDAQLRPEDIDRLILVGGSTRNRAVREIVAREIKEPYVAERVDEVVSHGAALVAASLFLPEEEKLPIEIANVTGHSLGIDVLHENQIVFRPIIRRQTCYPCRYGFLGSSRPMQPRVVMTVYRGEDNNPVNNVKLGQLVLTVSGPLLEPVPVAAIFELDGDGILHFTAVQLPKEPAVEPIVRHAVENDNDLDIQTVNALVRAGRAIEKKVTIEGCCA